MPILDELLGIGTRFCHPSGAEDTAEMPGLQ